MKLRSKSQEIFGFILVLLCLLCFSGCQKKEEEIEESSFEPSEEIPVTEVDVFGEEAEDVINIVEIPKEEWPGIPWETVRDFTLTRMPDFRRVYGIPTDHEMSQADWEDLKGIMFWQLFDQTYEQFLAVGNVYSDIEVVEDTEGYGEDWIYFAPTREYLLSLGPDEIADYFQNFYPKVYQVTPTTGGNVDEEGNIVGGTPIVWRDFSDEKLIEMMQIFIDEQF